ncbi:MAG: transcription factor FapR [Bacillota bacterium]|nr:transcription factor FapR [Bacillota bacterium]
MGTFTQQHRRQRLRALREYLERNPFVTDEELARHFLVSVQTVRLDRMALGIPELRLRVQEMARRAYERLRSVGRAEVVGELVELELGSHAVSLLETDEAMAFERSHVVRGQVLFAQAESLALAVIDAPAARTRVANAKFKSEVRVGERVVARAEVIRRPSLSEHVVLVESRAGERPVFRGKFMIVEERGGGEAL